MHNRFNKTSICSIVFVDIIDYSKKLVDQQIELKRHFNRILSEAVKDVAENDRIILDTGDGAAIALLGAPEEALFISLSIRDAIGELRKQNVCDLPVRTGINLGPVQVVMDINEQPNIIGDGLNVAQRVMSFAETGQILVSRSYYEVTSRLTETTMQMFSYAGVKLDKHVREHEVYAVRRLYDQDVPADLTGTSFATQAELAKKWHVDRELVIGLLLVVVLVLAILLGRNHDSHDTRVVANQHADQHSQPHEKDENKSLWGTFIQGFKSGKDPKHCSQAQKALNQCN